MSGFARGSHAPYEEGLCLMESFSVVELGRRRTANPPEVHPVVARAVQAVNDGVAYEDRAGLLPVLTAMAENVPGPDADDDQVYKHLCRVTAALAEEDRRDAPRRGWAAHDHWHSTLAALELGKAHGRRYKRPHLVLAAQHLGWGYAALGVGAALDYLTGLVGEVAFHHATAAGCDCPDCGHECDTPDCIEGERCSAALLDAGNGV